ncbi:hypothetical protein D3C78_1824410 [compost metagenome]
MAGIQHVDMAVHRRQVQRHHGELLRGAALQEQDLVTGRDRHQRAQILLGIVDDLHELLAAMAHFHHAHAGAVPVQHFRLGGCQHFVGQYGRTG